MKHMMKKLLISYVIILSFSVLPASYIVAQETQSKPASMIVAPDYFPRPVESTNFLGQTHNYSVTFRGNGEAVVSARIVFSNIEESTMSAMTLRVPRVVPQDVMAYQISREPQCIRYKTTETNPIKIPEQSGAMYQEKIQYLPSISPVCEEYQEPDFTQYWYGGNIYNKAQVTTGTDSITISLPKPVKPNGSGAFILYYRAIGYAKKDIYGAFNYTFESLKVEDRIQSLQVGISTDSDLILKDAKGNVNYQTTMTSPMAELKTADAAGVGFRNSQMDTVIQQIGYGTIVKTSSNLQPLDSYKVTGAYAEAQWMLIGKQISMWVIGIVIMFVIIGLFVRWLIKYFRKHGSSDSSKQKNSSHTGLFILEAVGVSFFSALLIAGYCMVVFFIASLFQRMYIYSYEMIGMFVMLLLTVISFAVVSLLLFGPAVFIGIKQGIWKGVAVFVATIGWLMMFFLVVILMLFTFRYSPNYPTPVYNMMGTSSGSSDVMMK